MAIPYVVSEVVWKDKDASDTKELKSEFERVSSVQLEVSLTGFSGTLDIQGRLGEDIDWYNIPYARQDQASAGTGSVSQITLTTETGIRRYALLGGIRQVRIVMTRTAGTITLVAHGSSAQHYRTV